MQESQVIHLPATTFINVFSPIISGPVGTLVFKTWVFNGPIFSGNLADAERSRRGEPGGRQRPESSVTQHSRDTPQFYLTAPSPCPYLGGKEERKVFTHLVGERAGELNNILTQGGFRRSQSIAYRPACEGCRACVSVRVIADEFVPTRSMRRIGDT